MNISYSSYSNIGGRKVNEDSIAISEKEGGICFILCDGLGGHGKGDIASKFVTGFVNEYFQHANDNNTFIQEVLEKAQNGLLSEQERLSAKREMKTTAVVLLMYEQRFRFAFIGDSRLYHFRKNKVYKRSIDHSVPQMLALAGEIKEKDIRHYADRNKLLRVMGTEWETPRYDVSDPDEISEGDAFLLCSDGFWENILEKDMCRFLKKTKNAEEWLSLMINKVTKNAENTNMDNNSAIAIKVSK